MDKRSGVKMDDFEKMLQTLNDVSEMIYQIYLCETDKESANVRYDQFLAIDNVSELLKSQQAEIDRLKDLQPKKGYWKEETFGEDNYFECPFCGYGEERDGDNAVGLSIYCPYCGAKLERKPSEGDCE